jgi:hypothetical protein
MLPYCTGINKNLIFDAFYKLTLYLSTDSFSSIPAQLLQMINRRRIEYSSVIAPHLAHSRSGLNTPTGMRKFAAMIRGITLFAQYIFVMA